MRLNGGCLCGAIRYQITGTPSEASNCHCSMCRKHSGAAFLSAIGVPANELHWLKGEDQLARYQSSPGGIRFFCRVCGSTMAGGPADPNSDTIWIMMGTLDDDPGIRPSYHIFVGSKAPWFEITDELPSFHEYPTEK